MGQETPEVPHSQRAGDHRDSPLYMLMRRVINERYAEKPIDFNAAGLEAGQRLLGRALTEDDVVVDIGSSSGQIIAEAAESLGIRPRLICVEADEEAAESYGWIKEKMPANLHFVRANGEALPLADNSVQGVSMHNVIFRSSEAKTMLAEAKRVVKPEGFIVISSNANGHAYFRHFFERQAAEEVMRSSGVEFAIPRPPAEGNYLDSLPKLAKKVGGLVMVKELGITQQTYAVITPGERLEHYLDSIKFSAANTKVPDHLRSDWRQIVDTTIRRAIEARMEYNAARRPIQGLGPYFVDLIHRGMFVAKKVEQND